LLADIVKDPTLSASRSLQARQTRNTTCAPGSANGRTIGYYQLNAIQRSCDTLTLSNLDTAGLTHLFVAFAEFDPNNFTITAANDTDMSAYSKFSSLASSTLETWISIGGFAFSTSGSPTERAWSDMTSSSGNRGAFIASLKTLLSDNKFSGVDLDWEFPGPDDKEVCC
jgi:chitinase